MDSLKDIIAYLLANYPHKHELSNARLTKMVYLADWRNVLQNGKQLTNIEWYFDNYGPFVWDVRDQVSENPQLFDMERTSNMFGNGKTLICLKDDNYSPKLSAVTQAVLDHVIKTTKDLRWSPFIQLVYGTYPIASSRRYSYLNLVSDAKQYAGTK